MKPPGLSVFTLFAFCSCAPLVSELSSSAPAGDVSAQERLDSNTDLYRQCMKKRRDKIALNETQCRIYAAAGESVILRGQAKTLFGVPNDIFWPYNPPFMKQPEPGVDGECGISFSTGSMDSDEANGKDIISSFGGWSGKAMLWWYQQKDKNRRRLESAGSWIEYNSEYKITSFGYDFNILDRAEGQTVPALGTPIWVCNLTL